MSLIPRPRRIIGVAQVPYPNLPSIVRAAETYREQAERIALLVMPRFDHEELQVAVRKMLEDSCQAVNSPTFAACHILAYNQHLVEGLPLTEHSLMESVKEFEDAVRARRQPWTKWLDAMVDDFLRYAHRYRRENA